MNYLFNHRFKLFTCEHAVNSSVDGCSTNVTKDTSWKDIFKGHYERANSNGTPEHLIVNGKKYTYVDKKYAESILEINFTSHYRSLRPYRRYDKIHRLIRRIWF